MARPQAADYEDKRDQIKRRSAKLFAENGFHSSSISDIAAKCSISKSNLYHYFNSKEQILYELLKDHADHLIEISQSIFDKEGMTPQERLRAFATDMITTNVKSRDKHTLILGELDALPKPQRNEIAQMLRQPIEIWFDTLAEVNPQLRDKEALKFPAMMMFLGMINWTHTWFDAKGPVSIEQFSNMICDTFFNGFEATSFE